MPAQTWILIGMFLVLPACESVGNSASVLRAPPPPLFLSDDVITPSGENATLQMAQTEPQTGTEAETTVALAPAPTLGLVSCRIKDRFDTKSALSFTSEDGRKTFALNMKTNGLEFNKAMLRLTYRFGEIRPDKRAHCRYTSPIQGLAPSVYRELVVRKDDTVWSQIREAITP